MLLTRYYKFLGLKKAIPVLLKMFIALGPPQNWEEFPAQALLQLGPFPLVPDSPIALSQ